MHKNNSKFKNIMFILDNINKMQNLAAKSAPIITLCRINGG